MFISFKYKIMFSFFLTELLFLSIIIVYNYNSVHKFTNELMEQSIQSNTLLFKELIKTPVMVYDVSSLDTILTQFAKLPNIHEVKIYSIQDKLLSEFTNKSTPLAQYKEQTFNINNDGMKVGKGSIVFDLQDVYAKINNNTDNIIKIALLEIFFSLLISYIIARNLSKHLTKLNTALKKFKTTDAELIQLDIRSNDEFKSIANNFQNMQIALKDAHQKDLDKELLIFKQSKMAQMGSMIGNIAHQWRQPLNIINIIAAQVKIQIALESLKNNDLEEKMSSIEDTVLYLDTNIDTFRNFLMEKKEHTDVLLSQSITTALNLIGVVLKDHTIKLNKDIEIQNEISIYMTSGELTEVIINIVNNAKDALIENKVINPQITVKLLQENDVSIITIQDNAQGIPEDVLPHIFDEYYSTKDKTKGMGLGLYMSQKIVRKSLGGTLTATNIEDGAQFTIEIPHDKTLAKTSK